MALILPGHDSKNGNENSCLFKIFKSSTYVLNKELTDQETIINSDSEVAIVHSYGFFIFLVGYQKGLFPNVESLLVIDGWFPKDCKFNGTEYPIELPKLPTVFFFPTFGSRKDYPLESIVRQAMITRKDIHIVRGIGFGHNLLFGDFDKFKANDLILNLQLLGNERTTDLDRVVRFPSVDVE